MASVASLWKNVLNVKHTVIQKVDEYKDSEGIHRVRVYVRVQKGYDNTCSQCGLTNLPGYDHTSRPVKTWRSVDWADSPVEVIARTHRVVCPTHGVVMASVPWAYPHSRFTKVFDQRVAWLSREMSRTAISEFMRVDWHTVGQCISRVLKDIEPSRDSRLDNLVHIGIDETSYRKGHTYITVVVNHDTNTVVWVADGHGKSVLDQFFNTLTDRQKASIRTVSGDGARWITDCVNEYIPHAKRCVDPFHVVQWAIDALDSVRREAWRKAYEKSKQLTTLYPLKRGLPNLNDPHVADVLAARKHASEVKNSLYALGKAPENLTDLQHARLAFIQHSDPDLYTAYRFKETLRLIMKVSDPSHAALLLEDWIHEAAQSGISAFVQLSEKIQRHSTHILHTIYHKLSNARIEATNNTIKLIIRRAYGFRNLTNMMNMIYLICSNLRIELPNRKPQPPEPNKHNA